MRNSRSVLWFAAGCLLFMPAFTPMMVDVQLTVWMFVVDMIKPNPALLFGSLFYWPVLIALTGWYWVWRAVRWVFGDEGPLPRFFKLLGIMWAPVYVIPGIVIISLLGWLICFYKAYEIHLGDKKDS